MPCRYVEAGMVAVACAVIVPFVAFAPCRGRPPPPAVGRLSSWYQQNAAWRAFSRKGNRQKSFYRIFLTKYNQHGKVRSSDTEALLGFTRPENRPPPPRPVLVFAKAPGKVPFRRDARVRLCAPAPACPPGSLALPILPPSTVPNPASASALTAPNPPNPSSLPALPSNPSSFPLGTFFESKRGFSGERVCL